MRDGAIVEAEAFGTVGADAAVDDGEGLSTLPNRDHIGLPTGEERLLDAGELLAVLQFVVEREGEAVLNVVLRFAVLDLADLVRIRVAPALIALLGEAADVAQRLGPGVVRIKREPLGKAALEGELQATVVGDSFGREIAGVAQVGELR